jgi:sulfonate transport system substrate-binding protein
VPRKLVVPGGNGDGVYLVVPANSSATTIEDLKATPALAPWPPGEFAFSQFLSKGLSLADFKINLNPQVAPPPCPPARSMPPCCSAKATCSKTSRWPR